MTRNVTRRRLAAAFASLPAARLAAQAPPQQEDLVRLARDRVRQASADLAKHQVPMSTEPAFVFKV